MSQTYADPDGTPAEGTPAAHRAALRAKLRQMPADTIAKTGDAAPVTATAEAAPPNFDAITTADPEVALTVLKAAATLGVDHATVNVLMDSQAFTDAVTGAAPDEIAAAIAARTTPRKGMAPNPAQGTSDGPVFTPPPTFRDKLRATLDQANGETNLGYRPF